MEKKRAINEWKVGSRKQSTKTLPTTLWTESDSFSTKEQSHQSLASSLNFLKQRSKLQSDQSTAVVSPLYMLHQSCNSC